MRFRSELLQPPKDDSEAILTTIYDVYRSPDGHIAGDEEDDDILDQGRFIQSD